MFAKGVFFWLIWQKIVFVLIFFFFVRIKKIMGNVNGFVNYLVWFFG